MDEIFPIRGKVNVKTNTTREIFVTRSLNTVAMIRGVSCELASWTITSSADETNTINVNIEDAMVPSTACAVSTGMSNSQPVDTSIRRRTQTAPIAATMPRNGKTEIEFET
jgi:hypothetical protein